MKFITQHWKGFISGVAVTSLLTAGASVFADPYNKQLNAVYNGIKIYMNGERITPKDSDGNIVEPFVSEGTTYLPVRGVASALGLPVVWDAKTNSVYLGQVPNKTDKGLPLLLFDRDQLDEFRLHRPDSLADSIKGIVWEGNEWKKGTPPSVMEKSIVPAGANTHDFVSMAIYYWPDPSKSDGKPYLIKDGEVNPEKSDPDKYDADRMNKMIKAVERLSLAYQLTGDETFAEFAANYLRVWFLNAETKMNPNMNYAQGIPGKSDGTPSGIIDGSGLITIVDSVNMLRSAKSWTPDDDNGMKKWFGDYLKWLRTSTLGQQESQASNNHGVWYDAQTAAYAWFAGETDLSRQIVEDAKKKRIDSQIMPDGTMPLEIKRTKSMQYTVFNLEAFITLARIGDLVGVDLWNYSSNDGRSIINAINFAFPFMLGKKLWEHEDIEGTKADPTFARYLAMASRHDAEIHEDEVIGKIFQNQTAIERIATLSFFK